MFHTFWKWKRKIDTGKKRDTRSPSSTALPFLVTCCLPSMSFDRNKFSHFKHVHTCVCVCIEKGVHLYRHFWRFKVKGIAKGDGNPLVQELHGCRGQSGHIRCRMASAYEVFLLVKVEMNLAMPFPYQNLNWKLSQRWSLCQRKKRSELKFKLWWKNSLISDVFVWKFHFPPLLYAINK